MNKTKARPEISIITPTIVHVKKEEKNVAIPALLVTTESPNKTSGKTTRKAQNLGINNTNLA